MKQELTFNIKHNNYTVGMYYFKTNKKPIGINEVDIRNTALSKKIPYSNHCANKYYIGYLSNNFRSLRIIIKEMKLYTAHVNILANNKEFSKYNEISNKIEASLNETFNKRGLQSRPTYNNEYIKTKIFTLLIILLKT